MWTASKVFQGICLEKPFGKPLEPLEPLLPLYVPFLTIALWWPMGVWSCGTFKKKTVCPYVCPAPAMVTLAGVSESSIALGFTLAKGIDSAPKLLILRDGLALL